MTDTALILGPTGRFGRHALNAFENAGWDTRAFRRGDDLISAAKGADVIVNGWNPAYPDWHDHLPGLTAQVIEAARASGATVLVPGNVYPFGEGAAARLDAATPHRARNPLGRARAEMEDAFRASGVRTIILRAGDFIDTQASGNWFESVIAAKASKGVFTYPGDQNVARAWAFLPDVARAAVQLAQLRETLDQFTDIPFEGYTLSGRALADAVAEATGCTQRIRPFPWWMIRVARPFWPMARHLLEMRYLWSMPHGLAGSELARLLPGFQQTPLGIALRRSLKSQIDPDKSVARRGHDSGPKAFV